MKRLAIIGMGKMGSKEEIEFENEFQKEMNKRI